VEDWLDAVRDAERRGELLTAVDLAEQGLAEHPANAWLEHRLVLALARAGATDEAAERFRRYGLEASEEEDIAALGARIAKDLALAAAGEERRREAARARDLYATIHARTGGYYPAINAATLSLVAGEPGRAAELARTVLGLLGETSDEDYWTAATEAEAHLLLGDEPAARDALARASERHGGDHGALSTTRRQLRLICEERGIDPELLATLAGPDVVHFCGHRIAHPDADGRFPAEAEPAVAARIAAAVASRPPGYAYGALASGADILWAEALLAHGAELHVVLPFASDEFETSSVASSGPGWIERFRACVAAAASVRFATDDAFLGDDVLYRYGGELAMGLALLHARYLDAEARQLAVWDGGPALGAAGTAIDVATWRRRGLPVTIVAPEAGAEVSPAEEGPARGHERRVVRCMLFADVKGFSKLSDEQLPRFASRVLGAFAEVLDSYGERVLHRNTWGDALYVVIADPVEAATCALALQDAMAGIDLVAEGLPPHLALRLGAHVGPVFPTQDPVLGELAFMGSHVSRTARIEPVTPPGEVYVTEPFAAALELDGQRAIVCDYVGHMPAAKDYGSLRMYRLRVRVSVDRQPHV
jgi:class 3 adenylate cyclase